MAFSVVGGVVRAEVEAVGHRAVGPIGIDEAGQLSHAFLRPVGDAAHDHAVGNGEVGTAYAANQAPRVGRLSAVASRDVDVGDAVGNGNVAIDCISQSGRIAFIHRDFSFYAQVLDDGAILHVKEGSSSRFALPVDRERVVLSVERADIRM